MYRYMVSRHDATPDTVLVTAWSPVEAKLEARKLWAARGNPAPLGIKITATRKHASQDEAGDAAAGQ